MRYHNPLYQSWQETDGVNQLGYLRRVPIYQSEGFIQPKGLLRFFWLITTKFDNFYEVKRGKKNKKQFLDLEVRVEWQESLVD